MNERTKLVIGRGIFTFIITVIFGLIIVNEKQSTILLPKVKNKINTYIEENYKDIKDEINIGDVVYESSKFIAKVSSKENEKHCFYVEYKNKKITDTYKTDYIEGKNILDNVKNSLEKQIQDKTNEKTEIKIISSLDKFTDQVKERIIKENDLINLKFYSINIELQINNWNEKEIAKEITNKLLIYYNKQINPKYYTITITNKTDITQSIEISNITNDFINNKYQEQIIKDIINDKNTQLLETYKITYSNLN